MSIYEIGNKIKDIWNNKITEMSSEVFVVTLIILVGLAGFGLGRLSVLDGQKSPISIQNINSNKVSAGVADSLGDVQGNDKENITGVVVASKNGTKYHYPWCSGAKSINESNRISFSSIKEARKAGYMPASNCKGLK